MNPEDEHPSINLNEAVLCVDCEAIYRNTEKACPVCASVYTIALGIVLMPWVNCENTQNK